MTDAIITHTLAGVPAGSPVCDGCKHRDFEYCLMFDVDLILAEIHGVHYTRHDACLAAEQRFTDQPPTEPGWYWARLRRTGKWRIVEVTMVFGELRAYSVVGKYGRSLTHFDSWSTRLTMPGGE